MKDLVARGELLYRLGRDTQAIAVLHDALAAEPERADAYCWLALCLVRRGRQADALAAAQRAVGVAPGSAWPYQVLATVLMRMRRAREALGAADEAVRLNPLWAPYHATRAWVLNSLRRYREGLAAAEEGLRLNPRDVTCARMRASALLHLRGSAAAEAALQEALGWHPEDPDIHHQLGFMLRRRRRFAEAAHHYRESLRLNPENEEAQYALREADEILQIRRGGLNALRVLGRRIARAYQPRRLPGAGADYRGPVGTSADPRPAFRALGLSILAGIRATPRLLWKPLVPFARIPLLPFGSRRRRFSRQQLAASWLAAVLLATIALGSVVGIVDRKGDDGTGTWVLCCFALPVTATLTAAGRRRLLAGLSGGVIAAAVLGLVLFNIDQHGPLRGVGAGGFFVAWLVSLASPWVWPAVARQDRAGMASAVAGSGPGT